MNKLTKLLSIFLIAGLIGTGAAVGMTGCKTPAEEGPGTEQGGNNPGGEQGGNTPGGGHTHTAGTEWEKNKTHHWQTCTANDGEEMNKDTHEYDNDSDADCNVCGYERLVIGAYSNTVRVGGHTVLTTNLDGKVDSVEWTITSGSEFASIDTSGSVLGIAEGKVTVKAKASDNRSNTITLTVLPVEYGKTETVCDFTNSAVAQYNGSSKKTPSAITIGRFTIGSGVYVENSNAGLKIANGDVNTQQKPMAVLFELTGEDGKNGITFCAKGSAGQTIELKKQGSHETVFTATLTSGDIEYFTVGYDFANNAPGEVTLAKGEYYIGSTYSLRIGAFKILESLPKSDPASIDVSGAASNFLTGQTFSSTGLSATLVNVDGTFTQLAASDCVIDSSAVNMNAAGKYDVTVKYTLEGGTKPFVATYPVYVYDIASAEIDFFSNKNTTQTRFRTVYVPGETLDPTGIVVKAVGEVTVGEKKLNHTFLLDKSQYSLSSVDLSTVGEKNLVVSVNGTDISENVTIKVLGSAEAVENVFTVEVGATKNIKTLNEALMYIKANKVADSVKKEIRMDDGEYYEKVNIDMPNVHLIGSNSTIAGGQVGSGEDKNNNVVIWYDALAGSADPAGTNYGTNGSGTVTVTKNATGFRADYITFKNYYNTVERYLESKNRMNDTQACAMVVESSRAEFYDCKFTSYHDTLYSNKGNHYYKDCFIEGRTDYIFGSDAVAYFDNCVINTVDAKDQDGQGGYICAVKPSNSTSGYKFIFNGCKLITPETGATNIALGRPWGVNMKMIVMNCEIDANYSKEEYTSGASKGKRYVSMSGNSPVAANMLEYNNTGDGAITATLPNTCTVIDAAAAAEYDRANFQTLLGFVPNTVDNSKTYGLLELITQTVTVAAEPVDIFGGEASVTAGKIQPNASSGACKIDAGTVIQMKVPGAVKVNWHSANYGTDTNVKIVYADHCATLTFKGESTGGGLYVLSLSVNPDVLPDDTPAAAKYDVSFDLNGSIGTAPATQQVEEGEKAEKPFVPLWAGHAFLGWFTAAVGGEEYNFDAAVTAAVPLYAHWSDVTAPVVFEKNGAINFGSNGNYQEYLASTALIEANGDATKFRDNGGNNSQLSGTMTILVKAGATVTVSSFDKYTNYTVSASGADGTAQTETSYSFTVAANDAEKEYATVTFACGAGNYFYSISVTYPGSDIIETSTTISFGTNNDWQSIVDSGLIKVTGQIENEGQVDCAHFKPGSVLTLKVKQGATVAISSYPGQTDYTVRVNGVSGVQQTGTSYSQSVTANAEGEEYALVEIVAGTGNCYIYSVSVQC